MKCAGKYPNHAVNRIKRLDRAFPRHPLSSFVLICTGSFDICLVCHDNFLFKVAHAHGVPDENIVVMMWDDVAYDMNNPIPGMIFNSNPDHLGPDVSIRKGAVISVPHTAVMSLTGRDSSEDIR